MLFQIKNLLQHYGQVSLQELSTALKTSPDHLRDMLNIYLKKNKVRYFQKTSKCGKTCQQCVTAATEIYEWIAP